MTDALNQRQLLACHHALKTAAEDAYQAEETRHSAPAAAPGRPGPRTPPAVPRRRPMRARRARAPARRPAPPGRADRPWPPLGRAASQTPRILRMRHAMLHGMLNYMVTGLCCGKQRAKINGNRQQHVTSFHVLLASLRNSRGGTGGMCIYNWDRTSGSKSRLLQHQPTAATRCKTAAHRQCSR